MAAGQYLKILPARPQQISKSGLAALNGHIWHERPPEEIGVLGRRILLTRTEAVKQIPKTPQALAWERRTARFNVFMRGERGVHRLDRYMQQTNCPSLHHPLNPSRR